MPDEDPDGPSLELPSFGFGRKRRKRSPEPGPAMPEAPVPTRSEPATMPTQELDSVAPPPEAHHDTGELPRDQPGDQPGDSIPFGVQPLPAALLTGVVVGLLTALLVLGSQQLCEAVRGTSSCGGAGVLMLLAIVVAMAALGSALLRLSRVPEPVSTSILAVGLLAVLVMLFLIDVAGSPAMFVVIPLLAAGCYAVAHWVTTVNASTD
ncbi:hypothetical protein [Nocardioides sp. LHG3406-4]|uniref:hypothetical protein n=1 Tax=Nocardioides sp. LHG3406-4 TaxID=2804575 RepID=UPI003CF2ACB5